MRRIGLPNSVFLAEDEHLWYDLRVPSIYIGGTKIGEACTDFIRGGPKDLNTLTE